MKRRAFFQIQILAVLGMVTAAPCLSQNGPALPGGAPAAGSTGAPQPAAAAPVPGPSAQQVLGGASAFYRRLPLNYHSASVRLEELRNIMPTARPKDFQDTISDYLSWLSDMADGHWKIYQAFSKIESMKAQAELEKQSTLKLGSLKRQAMLLKAEFLVRNNRQPEALQPLVDIVSAEPRTATGEAAYALLKEIGFSEEHQLKASNNSAPSLSAGQKSPASTANESP